MNKLSSMVVMAVAAMTLAACGGGGGSGSLGLSGGGSGSGGGGGSGGSGGTTTSYSMGNGSGSSFQTGIIKVTSNSLSAGGTTSLEVTIVDSKGVLYSGTAVTITFNSTCISQGLASVTATGSSSAGTNPNTIVSTTGTADATYTAKGCSGADVITASASVAGANLTATGTLTVAAAATGSIQFVSALPTTIGLKGTGQKSTSTVTFMVKDATGAPKQGVTVNFTLDSSVGGLSLSPSSAVSAADGTVQTIVSSGTVATSVNVTATISSPALTTQSSELTVTTGIPTSRAFSIAIGAPTYASPLNNKPPACPNVEAYGTDGVTVPVTVRLSDRYGNPVLDGTAVTFYTDGGQIPGSCTTAGGACPSVNWVSANPRPQKYDDNPPLQANGRVVILATATGEEWFDDKNGTGFYQSGDAFQNLGEPYDDANENGVYDPGEHFLDYNQNGKWDTGSGSFVGIVCTGTSPGSTCTENTLALGAQTLIIMSTAEAGVWNIVPAGPAGWTYDPTAHVVTVVHGTSGTLTFYVGDLNGNPIPAASTISVTADPSLGTLSGSTSVTEGCSASVGGDPIPVQLAVPNTATSGNITITVTSEGTRTVSPIPIPITVN